MRPVLVIYLNYKFQHHPRSNLAFPCYVIFICNNINPYFYIVHFKQHTLNNRNTTEDTQYQMLSIAEYYAISTIK